MALKLITAPVAEPVSVEQARAQCRVDGAESDAMLTLLISQARKLAEHKTGRGFSPATWELSLDSFPAEIILPISPLVSVESVKYLDAAGAEQTLSAAAYLADTRSLPARIVPALGASWPATAALPSAVRVRFIAGHAANDPDLDPLRGWMLLAIGTWFKHAEGIVAGSTVQELPRTYVDGLLDEYRIYQ